MRSLLSILILFSVLSCGRKTPELAGIDKDQWKEDRNACTGYRKATSLAMEQEMKKLKGLSENDIISLLGRPDQNELYKRNQKFYSYFLLPGQPCPQPDSLSRKLVLRFNAMGYAQQVSIESN